MSDRISEPFLHAATSVPHGFTFAGHPVSAAVALANLDILEREDLVGHVRANEDAFRATLEKLHDLPIVGDVRGDGYFYGIELVKDKATKETFDDEESERLLRGFLSRALFEAGLYCRADDRGDLGHLFGADRYGYQPDMITCAKGMTSGYSPIGACIVSDRIAEPFWHGEDYFPHGYTFGGHPVSAAVALENLAIFEEEKLNENVRENSSVFRATLEKLLDLPIVGEVRGDGYFYGIELVKDKATKETFDEDESERLLRGFLSRALFEAGLYCRADDRGDPVVQLAPPLICEQSHFDEIEQILRSVLTEAWSRI